MPQPEAALRVLRSLRAAGVRRVPRGVPAQTDTEPAPPTAARATGATPPASESAAPALDRGAPTSAPSTTTAPPLAPEEAAAALEQLAEEVRACRRCPLAETRGHAVPGEGNPRADIVFVGEGPGADEDRSGRPFVGAAGRLLDDIITKGMQLRREDVFICNVVKCRPPGNRVPTQDEVEACAGYLERQLNLIRPKVVCALGATAARRLLDTELSMARLRGRVHQAYGFPVIPTYHPAYLLRNPAAKRPTWEDIQKVMELAGGS